MQKLAIDSSYGHNFRIVSSGEYLVRRLQFLIRQNLLNHRYPRIAQEAHNSLASDASQKGSVRDRRVYDTSLSHEKIRRSQFGYVTQHITNNCVVEAPCMRVEECTSVVGIKATSLRIDRHRFKRWPTIWRQSDRESFGRTHWCFVNTQAPASGLW